MGGKSKKTSQMNNTRQFSSGTSRLAPWAEQYVSAALNMANVDSQRPRQYFPGDTTANLNPMYTGARDAFGGAVQGASGVISPMQQQITDTLSGRYMDPAFLQQMAAPGINQALSGINARTNLGGGRGSSLAAQAAGRAGAEAMAGVLGQERGRQLQAAAMAPQAFSLGLAPSQALMGQGLRDLALDQRDIDADIARFNFGQMEPTQRIREFANIVGSVAPLSGQYTQGTQAGTTMGQAKQPGGGLLGGLGSLAGYALGGPIGSSIAGGLGGLFGGGAGGPVGSGFYISPSILMGDT